MAKQTMTTQPKPANVDAPKKKEPKRRADTKLLWVARDFPQLSSWRILALEWLKGEIRGLDMKLRALVVFFDHYIVRQGLPTDPSEFLLRETELPEFYQTACPPSNHGVYYNNVIHAFLKFVLLYKFSEVGSDGQPVTLSRFRNPVSWVSQGRVPKRSESVHSPLPYGYIDEVREMIAQGPNFRDWHLVQNLQGASGGRGGRIGPDWFKVTAEHIDRDDPDCVWRIRTAGPDKVLEMWSPVRWVAILVKLILPLRTFQVRMLDSGEADTWHYAVRQWRLNTGRLAQGSELRPVQRGVFRRSTSFSSDSNASAVLYISTNKTADIAKSGPEKGYVLPWPVGGPIHQDVFYWLEKLRDWQAKYNPISRPTAWTELDDRHLYTKSEVQLASYPDTCFLFRMPESDRGESHLPLKENSLWRAWYHLLSALQLRFANRGESHRNGAPIRFLPPPEEQTSSNQTTLFPLHSLRVSLITALALEGQVPFPILQKLAGHSRLLMTLYYTKPGATHIHDVLFDATERLESKKEASIQNFLLNTESADLLQKAISNSITTLAAAVPQHPAARNPTGWMPMHHGLCLVGGNTSETEEYNTLGGCYNGGPNIGSILEPRYGPVPGGSRNCVRCRWFVTEPHYLPALAAHFNTLAYYFDEARNSCLAREIELQNLKKQRADSEDRGQPFTQIDSYKQAERVWESAMKRFSDLAEDLVACWRLIERCKAAFEAAQGDGTQLVAAGMAADVHVVFEETESEMLQLAGVCESAVFYPDLEPGKAVFRRSQLLDAVLYRESLPPIFITLSEEEQLLAGNAFLRGLAQRQNPKNPMLGRREVIRLIDAGVRLGQHFDMDLTSLLPKTNLTKTFPVGDNDSSGEDR